MTAALGSLMDAEANGPGQLGIGDFSAGLEVKNALATGL